MEKKIEEKKHYPLVYFVLFFAVLALVGYFIKSRKPDQKVIQPTAPLASYDTTYFKKDEIKQFASDADFITAMREGQESGYQEVSRNAMAGDVMMMKSDASPQNNPSFESVNRSSGTNVQVIGIDEPDIVKTDSSSIFFSKERQYNYLMNDGIGRISDLKVQGMPSQIMPRYQPVNEVVAIGALPPTAMKVQSSIPQSGDMLISGKTLVLFSNDNTDGSLQLVGYSIANPTNPKKLWELPFSTKSQKVAARLQNNTIYLVTATSPSLPRPCPMPLIGGKTNMTIRCTDIYAPSSKPNSNSVYSIIKINPLTGKVEKTMSFVGQQGQNTVYMSADSLYLSYQIEGNIISILNQFVVENQGVLPSYIEDKIIKLQGYDLSQSTKEMEINSLLSQYLDGMDDSERLKQENQLKNSFTRFFSKYKRSFEYTGIIKIKNDDLTVQATGKVPGATLNQFSFDEWKGDLRVATTIGGRSSFVIGSNGSDEQVSDVYILGKNLEIKGSVKDLGKTERIYSVRFIEDRGYVVTFRQTDPFYVLDLSNGNSPQLKGELKIPGYSSYLHPIDSHLVLGVGRESDVKLSLFDVSDPQNPKEVSKYTLSGEYWSEAMDNHHAFLQDPKYKVIFIPGSRGGYIISYEGNSLSLVKALEAPAVKRGLYLNDYFYIVSDTGITSYKEGIWDKVGNVVFDKTEQTPIVQTDSIQTKEASAEGSVSDL